MRRLCILVGVALVAACQGDAPTEAGSTAAPLIPTATAARVAIDDVVDRIVPVLGDAADRTQLAAALHTLRQTLDAGRVAEGPALARVAGVNVERYASLHPDQAPELDAIRLALGVVTVSN